jgi:hypothetical protein
VIRFRAKAIKAWREKWEKSLTPDEKRLYDAMREGRHDEAHIARKSRPARSHRRARKAGLKLCIGQEDIKLGLGASYSDRSGTVQAFGSPSVLLALGINPTAVIYKETYSFKIDGKQRKATEVCHDYLASLQRMVMQFETDHRG